VKTICSTIVFNFALKSYKRFYVHMSTIYNVDKSKSPENATPSVVDTVARSQIFMIIRTAIMYTNYEDAGIDKDTLNKSNAQKIILQENLLSCFYADSTLQGLPSEQRKILNVITQKVLDKARELELYKLYGDTQKQIDLMKKILQDITVEWADQVDLTVFQTFLLHFVRGFLDIKRILFNTNYQNAFKRNIDTFNKIQYSASIVSHLFNDTDVYWFITIPVYHSMSR